MENTPVMLRRSTAATCTRRLSTHGTRKYRRGGLVPHRQRITGEFNALVDADFKYANVRASETIQIDTFCDVAQIPAMYYEKPHCSPLKGGEKVYTRYQCQALEATNKAVATL